MRKRPSVEFMAKQHWKSIIFGLHINIGIFFKELSDKLNQ